MFITDFILDTNTVGPYQYIKSIYFSFPNKMYVKAKQIQRITR